MTRTHSENLEALLNPFFQPVLKEEKRDLRHVCDDLGRLRLSFKVKQLDLTGIIDWASHNATRSDYKAFQALSATYTEALHLIDHLMITSEALASVGDPIEAFEVLNEVLTNVVGARSVCLYGLCQDTHTFRIVAATGTVRPSEILEQSPLLEKVLATKERQLGLASDLSTRSCTRQLYLPLLQGRTVRFIAIASSIPTHLHSWSATDKAVLKLIEEFYVAAISSPASLL